MKNIVREAVLQSTPVFLVVSMHYQYHLFSESQVAKTPGEHILGGFSIKWVAGTTASSCYGCSLAIVNPPILPEHAFCIVHRDVKHYNNPVIRLLKITPNHVNVHFHPRVLCFGQRYPGFSHTDLILLPEYFHFLNTEHLSLLSQEFENILYGRK